MFLLRLLTAQLQALGSPSDSIVSRDQQHAGVHGLSSKFDHGRNTDLA